MACIAGAGSELDRTVPEGWALDRRAVRGVEVEMAAENETAALRPIEQNEAA